MPEKSPAPPVEILVETQIRFEVKQSEKWKETKIELTSRIEKNAAQLLD